MNRRPNYLLVTHIPFTRDHQNTPVVDRLWARDLIGLVESIGPVRVAAPEQNLAQFQTWGAHSQPLPESSGVTFRGFPAVDKCDPGTAWLRWRQIRGILREEIRNADLVHTSNFFPPYSGLSYAHDYAVRLGKRTLFVIAEDFHDMLAWEWVRPANGWQRWRRERTLQRLDDRAARSAASASLTLLHTPAAVERYRLWARKSMMIRQPGHELSQVIPELSLDARLQSLASGRSLNIVAACRHSALKGLDLLIRAIGLLRQRGLEVQLTMYGSGPDTPALGKLAESLGLADCVRMPGSLPSGEELDGALRRADLFAMPHRTTDFGRAFFDAMAAGLPVLAFRTPASESTVYDGQDGLLAPLDDVQGLAERIASLSRNRELLATLSHGARRRALENTRAEWFRMRAQWTLSMLQEEVALAA